MISVLLAYLLLPTNKIEKGKIYQSLNFIATTLMAIELFITRACLLFALQIACLIAVT